MSESLMNIVNIFFFVFHTALIIFNLIGWIHPKTRKLNFITLVLTFASWFVLGIWKGWGYCLFTDWHYKILRKLGETDMPNSYIAFLVERITGYLPEANLVDILTIVLAVMALIISIWVNFFRRR